MRDEVLAEWLKNDEAYSLHVYCQVSGGIGTSKFRDRIFRQELPLVLETFRYGDRKLYQVNPFLDKTQVLVHFRSKKEKYNRIEDWGPPKKYSVIKD
jgi:hypothetical protein